MKPLLLLTILALTACRHTPTEPADKPDMHGVFHDAGHEAGEASTSALAAGQCVVKDGGGTPYCTLAEQHRTRRWNVESTAYGVRICDGGHEKSEPCVWVEYVRKESADRLERELEQWQSVMLSVRKALTGSIHSETHIVEDCMALVLAARDGEGAER